MMKILRLGGVEGGRVEVCKGVEAWVLFSSMGIGALSLTSVELSEDRLCERFCLLGTQPPPFPIVNIQRSEKGQVFGNSLCKNRVFYPP